MTQIDLAAAPADPPLHPAAAAELAAARYAQKDYAGALEAWQLALAIDPADDPQRLRAPAPFRLAGIAAERLQQPTRAMALYRAGAAWAGTAGNTPLQAGLLADAAAAAWRAGDGASTAQLAAEAMDTLVTLEGAPGANAQAARKLTDYTLSWLYNLARDPRFDRLRAPEAGICSSPEAVTHTADWPLHPLEITLLNACELEAQLERPPRCAETHGERLGASRLPRVRRRFALLCIRRMFAEGSFLSLPAMLAELQWATWESLAQQRLQRDPLSAFDDALEEQDREQWLDLHCFLFAAYALASLSGMNAGALLRAWQADSADDAQLTALAGPALEALSAVVDQPVAAARLNLRTEGGGRLTRLGAALAVLQDDARAPADTLYAQAGLLAWLMETDARPALEAALPVLANVYADAWEMHLANPALLVQPKLSVPQLRAALDSDAQGAAYLGALLRAARSATDLAIPDALLLWLETHASIAAALPQ